METSNPYQTPEADVTVEDTDANVQVPKFFAIRGRIGRMRYWCYSMSVYLLSLIAAFVVAIIAATMGMPQEAIEPITTIAMLIFMIPMMGVFVVRRGYDMGKSAAHVVLILIPFINIIYGFYLTFFSGDTGKNEFGSPPSENTRAVKFGFWVAISTTLLVTAGVLVSILMAG